MPRGALRCIASRAVLLQQCGAGQLQSSSGEWWWPGRGPGASGGPIEEMCACSDGVRGLFRARNREASALKDTSAKPLRVEIGAHMGYTLNERRCGAHRRLCESLTHDYLEI